MLIYCLDLLNSCTIGASDDEAATPPPSLPRDAQCYWQIPDLFNITMDLCLFVLLGLTGEGGRREGEREGGREGGRRDWEGGRGGGGREGDACVKRWLYSMLLPSIID